MTVCHIHARSPALPSQFHHHLLFCLSTATIVSLTALSPLLLYLGLKTSLSYSRALCVLLRAMARAAFIALLVVVGTLDAANALQVTSPSEGLTVVADR